MYCRNSCTDPRDRVFALIGAVKDGEKQALKEYLPDYGLAYDEVVVIALAHIQLFGDETSPRHPLLTGKSPELARKLMRVATLFNKFRKCHSLDIDEQELRPPNLDTENSLMCALKLLAMANRNKSLAETVRLEDL